MKNKTALFLMLCSAVSLSACGRQSTPSMMNTSRPQLAPQTTMLQSPVKDVSEGYLQRVAVNYERYGADMLQLSLAYDPNSKNYGAVQAFKDLSRFKDGLAKMGVHSVVAETVKAEGSDPTLMVTYDAVTAKAPAGCRNMPGMDDGLTTENVGDYRFGCTADAMLAKQIYRPSDLAGNGATDMGDGRRAANTVEYYRQVTSDEAEGELQRLERGDIQQ